MTQNATVKKKQNEKIYKLIIIAQFIHEGR